MTPDRRSSNAGPRERLIASAIDLVQRNGVAATGISEILDNSKTARGSMYTYFPGGKEQLIEESTRAAGEFTSARIEKISDDLGAQECLQEYVQMWKKLLLNNDFAIGCPIAAAAMSSQTPAATNLAGFVFDRWTTLLGERLCLSGLDPSTARSLSTMAVSSVEGALILCRAQRSIEPLDRVERHLGDLVDYYRRDLT